MSKKLSQRVGKLASALSGAVLLAACFNTPALAQANWPERPIKLIVGYPPGGPVDVTGRTFARVLSEQLKQSVVIENRAGASGMLGADATAKATPDGYTLNFIASPTMTISPIVQRTQLFDPRQDFTMLGSVVNYTNVLLIGPQIPAKTVAELVAFAKANPEKVSFGSAGFGGSNHLSAELLVQSTNTTMLHVPYKGNSPAMMDVISGKITFMFDITSTGKVFVDSGQARALAVTSKERNPSLPNVPTMIEAGIADYEVVGWLAVAGPKNLPAAVVSKLSNAIELAKRDPAFRKSVEDGGYTIDQASPKELHQRMLSEYSMWESVIIKGKLQQ
ncbi:PBP2_Bug_TTT domain containing protein [Burkholderiaceae bacterium]|jgi:tripartite-type tricarboxylate transporter receptor subunit TctC